jgi:hypothetical protein
MKKQILTLFASALLTGGVIAQGYEINYITQTTNLSGTIHQEDISTNDQLHVDFSIWNRTGSTQEVQITRHYLTVPSDWSDQICWGVGATGNCYPVSTDAVWTSPDAYVINPDESGTLTIYVNPNYMTAPSSYRYYIGTPSNPYEDSLDVHVNSVAGIEVVKHVGISVSPNPASSTVSIKANTNNAHIKMVDVLGNVIMNDNFDGVKNLNVNEFKNGVYFIIIEGKGFATINRKLVVRH